MRSLITSLVLFAGLSFAQAPSYFGGAYMGFDDSATKKVSGGVIGGKLISDPMASVPMYTTISLSPGTNGASSTATAGLWTRVFSNDTFFVALQGAAGASSYANAIGLAFQTGGAIGYHPLKEKNFSLVFQPSAIKVNVGQAGNTGFTPQFKFGVIWAVK